MNEKIRKLLVEAREQTKEGRHHAPLNVWTEKFAELIIAECAELNFRELGLSGSSSFDVSRMIKEHFGVEK